MINEEQTRQLDPETDAYIVTAFMGQGSSLLQIHPYNVSPLQMILAGELLVEQGKAKMNERHLSSVIDVTVRRVLEELLEKNSPENKILVPTPKIVKNAK